MEFSTIIQLVFFALLLVFGILFAQPIWNATFGAQQPDIVQLRDIIDFMVCSDGSSLTDICSRDEVSLRYKTNSFFMDLSDRRAIIFFRADKDFQGIYQLAGADTQRVDENVDRPFRFTPTNNPRTIPNPCSPGSACLCEVDIEQFPDETAISSRNCYSFSQDAIFTTPWQFVAQPDQNVYAAITYNEIPGIDVVGSNRERPGLYPEFVNQQTDERFAQNYPPIIYIPTSEQGEQLFIEYVPPNENFDVPRILVSPVTLNEDDQLISITALAQRREVFDPESYTEITPPPRETRVELSVDQQGDEFIVTASGINRQMTYSYEEGRDRHIAERDGDIIPGVPSGWKYNGNYVTDSNEQGVFADIHEELSRMTKEDGEQYLLALHGQTFFIEQE